MHKAATILLALAIGLTMCACGDGSSVDSETTNSSREEMVSTSVESVIDGIDGEDGTDGKDGENGKDGKDGRDVQKMEFNAKGELIVFYTDGTTNNLGKIPAETPTGEQTGQATTSSAVTTASKKTTSSRVATTSKKTTSSPVATTGYYTTKPVGGKATQTTIHYTITKDNTTDNTTSYQTTTAVETCDICWVVIDGVSYVQFYTDVEAYTLDTFLGSVSDHEGKYLLNGVAAILYTTKEDPDVLIVKLGNGGTVALRREKQ